MRNEQEQEEYLKARVSDKTVFYAHIKIQNLNFA
jgi:hypothetical protein